MKFPICELSLEELRIVRAFNINDIRDCVLNMKHATIGLKTDKMLRANYAQWLNRYAGLKASLEADNVEIDAELEKRNV